MIDMGKMKKYTTLHTADKQSQLTVRIQPVLQIDTN